MICAFWNDENFISLKGFFASERGVKKEAEKGYRYRNQAKSKD